MRARCNLAGPIVFGKSEINPTIQVADVTAGATADVFKRAGDSSLASLASWVNRNLHGDHILPDPELIDTRLIEPRVNLAVLRDLARRADCAQDPLKGMDRFYNASIKRFRSPAARIRSASSKLEKKKRH
jgi:hypothetical protein